METSEQQSQRLADEAKARAQQENEYDDGSEDSEDSEDDHVIYFVDAPVVAPVAPDHYRGLPATPTETDPATGRLVATTPQGVKYFYRTHTDMGTPIAPSGYPEETAEQEVTRKRQREEDGTWGIYPNKWCGVRRCDQWYCTHIAR